jgi:hypothetical protein
VGEIMINGTAFIKVKEKLVCLDEDCRGVLTTEDGYIGVGVFIEGKLSNIRCTRCRGPIREVLMGINVPRALAELKYEMA